jgi:Alginate lyase
VHKTSEDGIIVYLDGVSGKLRWKQDSVVQSGSLGDYTLGEYVNIGLSVHGGLCTIYLDDVPKAEGKLTGSSAKTCYFKTGCYNQDNSGDDDYPDDAVNEVRIAAVRVAHNIPWTPGGYTPVGPGVATKSGLGSGIPGHAQKPCDLLEFAGPHQAWKLTLDVDDDGQDSADAHDYGEALFRSITVETET